MGTKITNTYRQLKDYRGHAITKRTYTEWDTCTRRMNQQDVMYEVEEAFFYMSTIQAARACIRVSIACDTFTNDTLRILKDDIDPYVKRKKLLEEWSFVLAYINKEANGLTDAEDAKELKIHYRQIADSIYHSARLRAETECKMKELKGQRVVI